MHNIQIQKYTILPTVHFTCWNIFETCGQNIREVRKKEITLPKELVFISCEHWQQKQSLRCALQNRCSSGFKKVLTHCFKTWRNPCKIVAQKLILSKVAGLKFIILQLFYFDSFNIFRGLHITQSNIYDGVYTAKIVSR